MIKDIYVSHNDLFIIGKHHCLLCNIELKITGFHYYNRNFMFTKKPHQEFFCASCIQELSPEMMIGVPEIRFCKVSLKIPRGTYPLLMPTELMFSKTIPEAMETLVRDGKTIDRTRWAGRDISLDGTEQIGMKEIELSAGQEQKESLLKKENVKEYLLSFTPIIKGDDKKVISYE